MTGLAGASAPPRSPLGLILIAAIGCALAPLLTDYRLFQATQVMIFAIALLGLNLVTGWCGQISLGHGAFFGLGSYCSAILMLRFGLADWMTLPIAAFFCFASGWLFGHPAARLQGLHLALASFALAAALPQLLKHRFAEPLTGGTGGLALEAAQAPAWWPASPALWLYAQTLAVLIIMIALSARILASRHGRAMIAVRDHALAAGTLGIDAARTKVTAFALSAMYAGIAGALSTSLVRFVSPDSFDVFLSITFLVGIVIGGLASVSGSLIGALFIQIVPLAAEQVSREVSWAIYGAVLLLCLWLMPGGVVAFWRQLRR
jgi:branched-chain amino acid transport system permease protein